MTNTDDLRLRPDGSIDTAFYMTRGRHIRSRHAHALLRRPDIKTRKTPSLMRRIFG